MSETSNTPSKFRPKNLTGDVVYEVHSRNAFGLFVGRRNLSGKPDIPGLYRFAKAIDLAYRDARTNKPYALWVLCKVEDKIGEAREVYDSLLSQLSKKFAVQRIRLDRAVSAQPSEIPIKSTSPYPYMAGSLLIKADDVFCAVLQHQHIGNLTKTDAAKYHGIIHNKFRAVMEEGAQYRSHEITFGDVQKNTEAYKAISERYEAVPQSIISGEWTPEHGPEPLTETEVTIIKAYKKTKPTPEQPERRASA